MHRIPFILVLAGVACWAGAAPAADETILDELAGEAVKTPPPGASGEIRHDGEWVAVDELFGDYQSGRAEVQALARRLRVYRDELNAAVREIRRIRYEYAAESRPLRQELSEARRHIRHYRRVLNSKPPRKPRYEDEPPKPSDERLHGYWERQKEAVRRRNRRRKELYQERKERFEKDQEEARKEKPKLEKRVEEIEGRLEALRARHDAAVASPAARRGAAEEAMLDVRGRGAEAAGRVRLIEATLDEASEELLLKHGILKWRGAYRSVDEAEALLAEMRSEIESERARLAARLEARGEALPEDWRHPRQDEIDRLARSIDEARTARGE